MRQYKFIPAVLWILFSLLITGILSARDNPTAGETLSVLYFDNITKNREYEWLSKGIADMLISGLAENGSIDVVERTNLKKVLDEQQLSVTGLMDDKKALEIGRLMSASKLLYGSFIIRQKTVIINAKITDTASGKILSAFSVNGELADIMHLQSELLKKTEKAFGISSNRPGQEISGYSAEAVKKYYQGLDLLDRGSVDDARKKFEEASKIDPYYIKPYKGIEESYKFLKDFTKMRQQREIAAIYDRINKIQSRLKEKPWRTFAGISSDPHYERLRIKDKVLYEKEIYAYHQGDTPAVCTWNLQKNLFELAGLYEEYFKDKERAGRLFREIIAITEKSREIFAKDPFLPEILYSAVRADSDLEQWDELKRRCEELMTGYPDYRMMWAIEDFYKRSLEELSKKK